MKNRLVIFWNLTKNALIAEVHLNAKGWFSLGISSSKDTIKSDLLMAWIADEKAYFFVSPIFKCFLLMFLTFLRFKDCHVNNSQVIIDKNSSYELLYATETNNNLTIFRFRREAILCDLDDKTIEVEIIIISTYRYQEIKINNRLFCRLDRNAVFKVQLGPR